WRNWPGSRPGTATRRARGARSTIGHSLPFWRPWACRRKATRARPLRSITSSARATRRLSRRSSSRSTKRARRSSRSASRAVTPPGLRGGGGGGLRGRLETEAGERRRGGRELRDLVLVSSARGRAPRRLTIDGSLPLGYHRLELILEGEPSHTARTVLVVAPR